jgi:hypothetical protein
MSTLPPTSEPIEQVAPRLAFWLVLCGVPTSILNRAIIPALPGSRSGIEQILDRALAIGSVSSQLLALVIALLLVRLIVSSIGAAAIGALERLFVLPIGSAVGFLVVAASASTLDPELHLLLAGISSAGLLICARPALRHPSTRAGGIILALVIMASVCFATARLVALRASIEAIPQQYTVARWLATAGQVFDWLSLLWAMVWIALASRSRNLARVSIVAVIVIAAALTILARLGQRPETSFVQVVAARAFGSLAREPSPYGASLLGPAGDLLGTLLSLVLLSERNSCNMVARRAMALLLLGRCSLDVPALAGMATAGGLLLAWFTPHHATGDPSLRIGQSPSQHPPASVGTDSIDDAITASNR